jgi:hypothetical protein
MLFLVIIVASILCISRSTPSDFFSFQGGNPRNSGNSDDGSYYKALGEGIDKHSNVNDIKKAYRKKAMQLHPDKGGNAEEFKALSEAYEVSIQFMRSDCNRYYEQFFCNIGRSIF